MREAGGMSELFTDLTLRETTFRNRVWVSAMCQYSSIDGHPTDWHLVHLGGLARGGAGPVMSEATAVSPEGRISPADAGIWDDSQGQDYERVTRFVREQGAVPGVQLAHAGRKASTSVPWQGRGYVEPTNGGWTTVGPSAVGFASWPAPHAKSVHEVATLVDVSSRGLHPDQRIPAAPGYQVPFARAVREHSGVATCAVELGHRAPTGREGDRGGIGRCRHARASVAARPELAATSRSRARRRGGLAGPVRAWSAGVRAPRRYRPTGRRCSGR